MYRWARGVWSTLSQTEKQALYRPRIKSTIFEDVLAGRWRPPATLIPARLTHEEDLALRQWDRPLSRLWMHEDHVEAFLSREKMYGLEVPVGYGGCGFSPYLHARLLSRIASVDRSGRWIHQIMVPNSLGPAQLLLRYGTEKQRMVLLPDIASGEKIPCFALTGPHNGSDAAAMPITGRVEERAGVVGIRFSCEKRWITLAPIARLLGVAVRVEGHGICLLLIDRSQLSEEEKERIEIRWHRPIGSKFPNGHVKIDDLWVSRDNGVIGGADGMGRGWTMLMECLQHGRGISLPSVSLGGVSAMVWRGTFYALTRRQFQKPLVALYGVQRLMAENAMIWIAMKALQEYYHAGLVDGDRSSAFSALMKWVMTDLNRTVVLNTMDLFAGKGITTGEKNPILHHYLQTPIGITVEGSNTLNRHVIVPVQALFENHPHFPMLCQALEDDDASRFYQTIRGWAVDLARHAPTAPFSERSALVWDQFYLLCHGPALRKRQDLTRGLADRLAGQVLQNAIEWFAHHQSVLRSWSAPALRYIRHRYGHRGDDDGLSRPEAVSAAAEIFLRDRAVRDLLEEDILFPDDDPLIEIRNRWDQSGTHQRDSFSETIPVSLMERVIGVDSYERAEE